MFQLSEQLDAGVDRGNSMWPPHLKLLLQREMGLLKARHRQVLCHRMNTLPANANSTASERHRHATALAYCVFSFISKPVPPSSPPVLRGQLAMQ